MSITAEQLARDLTQSGLLDADDVAAVQLSVPEDSNDAQQLAKALIRQKKLTKFQATMAFQGKAKNLVFGEYIVLDKIGAGGMGQVFRARHHARSRYSCDSAWQPLRLRGKSGRSRLGPSWRPSAAP